MLGTISSGLSVRVGGRQRTECRTHVRTDHEISKDIGERNRYAEAKHTPPPNLHPMHPFHQCAEIEKKREFDSKDSSPYHVDSSKGPCGSIHSNLENVQRWKGSPYCDSLDEIQARKRRKEESHGSG